MSVQATADVWMLTTYSLWDGGAYGVRVQGEAAALEAQGTRVGFLRVVPASVWFEPGRRTSAQERTARGRPVIDIAQPPHRGSPRLRALGTKYLGSRVKQVSRRRGIDVLHAQGMRAGSLANQLPPDVHVVVDVHGDLVAEAVLACGPGEGSRVAWANLDTARALHRADSLIAVSPAMGSWLRSLTTANPRLTITQAPCGVDLDRFRAAIDARRPRGGRLRVIYVGGLQAYQPPWLIAACCRSLADVIPETEFRVVTPGRHQEVVEAFDARRLDVEVRSASFDEVPSLMADADLGIVPRVQDQTNAVASPTKIAEYLAAGVPVACSPYVGGWAQQLTRDGVGISLACDGASLRAFAASILRDREGTAAACRLVAERDWAWDHLVGSLIAAYPSRGDSHR